MTTNKTLAILTISLLTLLVLAACGSQPAAAPQETQSPPTQPEPAPTQTSAPEPTQPPAATATEAPTEAPPQAAAVSFVNDVFPIIESRCVNCHGGERVEEGLLMRTYDELMAGSDNGLVITAGDPTNSLLVQLVTEQKMPKRGPKLTPPQIQIITDWVLQGAQNN